MEKFRYPGPFPFDQNQEDIFFGRDAEIDRLYTKIMTNPVVVLNAESGSGKSSLVNAGLIPEILRNNPEYIPVTIRFEGLKKDENSSSLKVQDNSPDAMIKEIINLIRPCIKPPETPIPYLLQNENDLWYWNKILQASDKSLLLIFDQFENIESYKPGQVVAFKKNLAQLFNTKVPDEYYKFLYESSPILSGKRDAPDDRKSREEYNTKTGFIRKPLETKALFIVQDDKLNVLNRLKDYFPNIFLVSEQLNLLDEASVENVIIEPGRKKGDFTCPEIIFDKGAISFLKEDLTDDDNKLYDPLEIQIICSYVERKIIDDLKKGRLQKTPDGNVFIQKEYLPDSENIISFFYKDCWEKVKPAEMNDEAFDLCRKEIIDELVVGGVRVPVYLDAFPNKNQQLILKLEKTKLIRPVIHGGNNFYQLCHNRFIEPLKNDKRNISEKEINLKRAASIIKEKEAQNAKRRKRAKIWYVVGMLVIILASAGILLGSFELKARKQEQENIMNIITTLERSGNPTLGYIIGRDWLNNNSKSATVQNRLKEFDSANYIYLQGIYPSLTNIACADISENGRLIMYGNSTYQYCNLKSNVLTENVKYNDQNTFITRSQTTSGYLDFYRHDSIILVKDDKGQLLTVLPTNIYFGDLIAASPDYRYMLLDDQVFDTKTRKKITRLSSYQALQKNKSSKNETRFYSVTTSVFLTNDLLAVAYDNGQVMLYKVTGNSTAAITPYDTLELNSLRSRADKANDQFYGTKNISTMKLDRTGEYLFVPGEDNEIQVYNVTKLIKRSEKNDADVVTDNGFITNLRGHSGNINYLTFSSDNKLMLSGSADNTVIVWNPSTMKRITSFKGPGVSGLTYLGFSGNDKNIVMVSGNNRLYLWKNVPPLQLYTDSMLYRFSPLNYALQGLNEEKQGKPRPVVTASDLFSNILNGILNFPTFNEHEDKSYNKNLADANSQIVNWYETLVKRADYETALTADNRTLLETYFTNFQYQGLDILPGLKQLPDVDKDIFRLKYNIPKLEKLIKKDSAVENIIGSPTEFGTSAGKYLENESDYPAAVKYMQFYTDSILQPFSLRYKQNERLKILKKEADRYWLYYFIYSKNYDSALKKAYALQSDYTLKNLNSEIYIIAVYLAFEKYDNAVALYKKLLVPELKKNLIRNRVSLWWLLLKIRKREIGEKNTSIINFEKEFNM